MNGSKQSIRTDCIATRQKLDEVGGGGGRSPARRHFKVSNALRRVYVPGRLRTFRRTAPATTPVAVSGSAWARAQPMQRVVHPAVACCDCTKAATEAILAASVDDGVDFDGGRILRARNCGGMTGSSEQAKSD